MRGGYIAALPGGLGRRLGQQPAGQQATGGSLQRPVTKLGEWAVNVLVGPGKCWGAVERLSAAFGAGAPESKLSSCRNRKIQEGDRSWQTLEPCSLCLRLWW